MGPSNHAVPVYTKGGSYTQSLVDSEHQAKNLLPLREAIDLTRVELEPESASYYLLAYTVELMANIDKRFKHEKEVP